MSTSKYTIIGVGNGDPPSAAIRPAFGDTKDARIVPPWKENVSKNYRMRTCTLTESHH